jgi:hypothetical protein
VVEDGGGARGTVLGGGKGLRVGGGSGRWWCSRVAKALPRPRVADGRDRLGGGVKDIGELKEEGDAEADGMGGG